MHPNRSGDIFQKKMYPTPKKISPKRRNFAQPGHTGTNLIYKISMIWNNNFIEVYASFLKRSEGCAAIAITAIRFYLDYFVIIFSNSTLKFYNSTDILYYF
jgi:hypothetical protein